jgi:flagellar motor switch protein FliN/FliY
MENQKAQEESVVEEETRNPGEDGETGATEVSFPPLSGKQGNQSARELEFILDLPLQVTVELGRTRMVVNDLLQLAQGSIVELEKTAGDPLEILVNDKLIARGEVVAVNEKFGIRVTEIISPTDRIVQLA